MDRDDLDPDDERVALRQVLRHLEVVTGQGTDRNDEVQARKLLRSSDAETASGALQKAFETYLVYDDDGAPTTLSWQHAWQKSFGIARNRATFPDCAALDQLVYIRQIVANNCPDADYAGCLLFLVMATEDGVPVMHLERSAQYCTTYQSFKDVASRPPEDWKRNVRELSPARPNGRSSGSVRDHIEVEFIASKLHRDGIDASKVEVGAVLLRAVGQGLPINVIRDVADDTTDVRRLAEKLDAALYRYSRPKR